MNVSQWLERSPKTAAQVPCCWQLDFLAQQPERPGQVTALTIPSAPALVPSSGLAYRLSPLDRGWIGTELIAHPEGAN